MWDLLTASYLEILIFYDLEGEAQGQAETVNYQHVTFLKNPGTLLNEDVTEDDFK